MTTSAHGGAPTPLWPDSANSGISLSRPRSSYMDAILGAKFHVLDYGFIRVVDYMSTDDAIVQAARVSTDRGLKSPQEDQGLINYLMRNAHTSPFEMPMIRIHCAMPIFVARQWIRHRTASVNEQSARYSVLPNEFYIPRAENLAAQSTTNHQGRGAVLGEDDAARVLSLLRTEAERAYFTYQTLLNENPDGEPITPEYPGIARELARMKLSLDFYTQWYWQIDLHNLFHFLKLRADPHAQYEIRVYAEVIWRIVQNWVPRAAAAFEEYDLYAAKISRTGIDTLRRLLAKHGCETGWSDAVENARLPAVDARELHALLFPGAA